MIEKRIIKVVKRDLIKFAIEKKNNPFKDNFKTIEKCEENRF